MRDINPNAKPYLWALAIALLSLILFLLSGCSEAKKGQKAVNRVNADANLQGQVASKYLEVHPCVVTTIKNDSIIFKTDTLKLTEEKKIFIPTVQYKTRTLDTIVGNISVYADTNGIVIKNLNPPSTHTTQTIYKTIVDQSLSDRLTDSLSKAKQEIANQKGQNEQLTQSNNTERKGRVKYEVWFWLSIAVLIGSHIARFFIKLPSIGVPKL